MSKGYYIYKGNLKVLIYSVKVFCLHRLFSNLCSTALYSSPLHLQAQFTTLHNPSSQSPYTLTTLIYNANPHSTAMANCRILQSPKNFNCLVLHLAYFLSPERNCTASLATKHRKTNEISSEVNIQREKHALKLQVRMK